MKDVVRGDSELRDLDALVHDELDRAEAGLDVAGVADPEIVEPELVEYDTPCTSSTTRWSGWSSSRGTRTRGEAGLSRADREPGHCL